MTNHPTSLSENPPARPVAEDQTPAKILPHPSPMPAAHSGSKFFSGGSRLGKSGLASPRTFVDRGQAGRTSHEHPRGRSH